MATANYLPDVLETTEPERLATGFIFTEGPLWHPDGFCISSICAATGCTAWFRARSPSLSGPRSAATARPSICKAG